jgi:hypothetical protein
MMDISIRNMLNGCGIYAELASHVSDGTPADGQTVRARERLLFADAKAYPGGWKPYVRSVVAQAVDAHLAHELLGDVEADAVAVADKIISDIERSCWLQRFEDQGGSHG